MNRFKTWIVVTLHELLHNLKVRWDYDVEMWEVMAHHRLYEKTQERNRNDNDNTRPDQ